MVSLRYHREINSGGDKTDVDELGSPSSQVQPFEVSGFPETSGDLEFPHIFPPKAWRLNFCKGPLRKLLSAFGQMGPGKMGKLPEHVPFYTHFPPFLSIFDVFNVLVTLPHFPPFPPIFRGLPETGTPPVQVFPSNTRM